MKSRRYFLYITITGEFSWLEWFWFMFYMPTLLWECFYKMCSVEIIKRGTEYKTIVTDLRDGSQHE